MLLKETEENDLKMCKNVEWKDDRLSASLPSSWS